MTKEIIWNSSLLIFGIFLVLVFTMNTIITSNLYVTPGWHSDSLLPPFGFWNKIKLGLIVGGILIIFRYLNLGILSIANKDLRLIIMLLGYSFPILIVLIGLHLAADNTMNNFSEMMYPIQPMKREIGELRKGGMFKLYADKTDEFVTELAIGRAISKQGGWANSGQLWNAENNQVNTIEILRLDSDKVWQEEDTEFVVQGNLAYEAVIAELGQISEGHFKPTDIKEEWESSEKVKVSFKNKGEEHAIYPKVYNDWADMDGILKYLNDEILNSVDYQFYYAIGDDILVIGLTEKEREKLNELTKIEFKAIK